MTCGVAWFFLFVNVDVMSCVDLCYLVVKLSTVNYIWVRKSMVFSSSVVPM